MGEIIDMTGLVIGKLTVQYMTGKSKQNQAIWHCKCECGNEKDVLGASLRGGKTKTCGKCPKRSFNTWNLNNDYGVGYDNKGNEFYFSKQDFELIKDYYWRVHKNKYVSTTIQDETTQKGQQILLHRFLMKPNDNQEVDHQNHKPFDNRRENLRVVTTSQNQMNSVLSSRNTSGIKGVDWVRDINKWRVRISVNGKRITVGNYVSLDEAAKARQDAEIKYFGEYRYQENTGVINKKES